MISLFLVIFILFFCGWFYCCWMCFILLFKIKFLFDYIIDFGSFKCFFYLIFIIDIIHRVDVPSFVKVIRMVSEW